MVNDKHQPGIFKAMHTLAWVQIVNLPDFIRIDTWTFTSHYLLVNQLKNLIARFTSYC